MWLFSPWGGGLNRKKGNALVPYRGGGACSNSSFLKTSQERREGEREQKTQQYCYVIGRRVKGKKKSCQGATHKGREDRKKGIRIMMREKETDYLLAPFFGIRREEKMKEAVTRRKGGGKKRGRLERYLLS